LQVADAHSAEDGSLPTEKAPKLAADARRRGVVVAPEAGFA